MSRRYKSVSCHELAERTFPYHLDLLVTREFGRRLNAMHDWCREGQQVSPLIVPRRPVRWRASLKCTGKEAGGAGVATVAGKTLSAIPT